MLFTVWHWRDKVWQTLQRHGFFFVILNSNNSTDNWFNKWKYFSNRFILNVVNLSLNSGSILNRKPVFCFKCNHLTPLIGCIKRRLSDRRLVWHPNYLWHISRKTVRRPSVDNVDIFLCTKPIWTRLGTNIWMKGKEIKRPCEK